MKIGIQIGLLGIVSLLTIQSRAFAGGTVTSCNEAALRAALAEGGTVTFNCDGTIALTGTLAITSSTILDAEGHAIILSGNGAVRVFQVNTGMSLTLRNLTVTNGFSIQGGGLYNNGGNVVVSNCTLSGNRAGSDNDDSSCGGAIYQAAGTLTLLNSAFSKNAAIPTIGFARSFGGAIWFNGSVSMTNCTFSGNWAAGANGYRNGVGDAYGGAIYTTNGTLTGWNCWFTNNLAYGGLDYYSITMKRRGIAKGGTIFCSSGSVTLINGAIVGGCVTGAGSYGSPSSAAGGGIFHSNGTLMLSNVMVLGNSAVGDQCTGGTAYPSSGADGEGGGIYANNTSVTLVGCYIATNSASGGPPVFHNMTDPYHGGDSRGGGIYCAGTLKLSCCTLASNSIAGGASGDQPATTGGNAYGAGVFSQGNQVSLVNCTLAGNYAQGGNGGPTWLGSGGTAYGGGVYNASAQASLTNCTLAANRAISGLSYSPSAHWGDSLGGNIAAAANVQLVNVILFGGVSNNAYGSLMDLGHNISSDNSAGFSAPGSLNNTDPKLGPLANNGGPTLTLALMPDSPAIDVIPAAQAPATDQRGYPRPYNTASDIGAYEWSPLYAVAGKVWGLKSANGVIVTAGSASTTADNSGIYLLNNLVPGSYTVTPSHASYVFVPNSRSVTLGPDQTNVDFKAYGWNAIGLEGISNGMLQLRYAGTNDQTYRMLTATNLTGQWLPVATNTLSASNYFDVFLPLTAEPGRFYRTVSP